MDNYDQNVIDTAAELMEPGNEYDPYRDPLKQWPGCHYPAFQEGVSELSIEAVCEVSKAFAEAWATQDPSDFANAGKMLATQVEAYWEKLATAKAHQIVSYSRNPK